MPYSQSSKKATLEYRRKKLERWSVELKQGTKDRWKDAAAAAGESMTQYVIQAVERRIEAESGGKSG